MAGDVIASTFNQEQNGILLRIPAQSRACDGRI
jgi:hypothetical protein